MASALTPVRERATFPLNAPAPPLPLAKAFFRLGTLRCYDEWITADQA